MSIKLGITGGIGSGKSVVSRLLRMMNIPVYDCDSESKRLVNHDISLRQHLISLVGNSLYTNDILHRELLASYIFGNAEHLRAVNAIIHPAVKKDFLAWTKQHYSYPIVGIESAILIDAGFASSVDFIINVTAPIKVRIQRICERDDASIEQIKQRLNCQISDEERCKKADYIIVNDNRKPLIKEVLSIIASLSEKQSLSSQTIKN